MHRAAYLLSTGFIFSLAAAFPRAALATQPLADFVSRASNQSFDSRESGLLVEQRDAESDAALGKLLPVLSARGVYTRNQREVAFGGMTIQKLNQLDGYVQLDVPIIDLANYHRYKAQQSLAQVSVEQRAGTTIDVSRSVTRAYFQFLGSSALANSARLSTKAAQENARIVEDRRNAGVATDLDRERAVANLERSKQDVADAELAVDLSARSLETMSGMLPTPAEPTPGDDLHAEPPLAEWLRAAANSPQDRVARASREASLQSQKAAKRALLPTLSATAQQHVSNSDGITGSSAYVLSLTAAIRLDYGTWASSRAQLAAAQISGVREERTRRGVDDAVFDAFRRVETGIVKSRAARAQAAAAERASALASERYVAGAATQLDVTQAQRDAFLADAGRIQADADLAYARAALRLSAGLDPKPGNLP